jgi:NADH-quinone oxidoreductase subunit D/NADH-quinone oxidoreductase subunit C/D
MSEQILETAAPVLPHRFVETALVDSRPGFQGFIVTPDALIEFATAVRDELGYDLLSSVTAVDHFPEDRFEVVYHVFKTTGGPGFEYKVPVSRSVAAIPSLVSIYPGAELQEREAWDLMGIRFEGHPDLRRILTWEGFAGHPLRKDWKEPFYEEDVKPYKTRWPDGKASRIEDRNPFGDNVQYPVGFNPETWTPEAETLLYSGIQKAALEEKDGIKTDQLVVNMGPQHPSTHGVFRMVVSLDGETITALKPVVGYLHRNHEKIGERSTFMQIMPFTDRLDYISSMSNNFGYALAVEKLMGVKPPERAEYIRVMMAELTRMVSHMMSIGFLLNDLGAYFTPALYALEERELVLDVFEAVSGSRMMCNYFRFGGVARDLPEGILGKVRGIIDRVPRKLDEWDKYLTKSEIVQTRCQGVGVLAPERAIALSATGPLLRASGVPYDIRRADPYSIYDRLGFDVAVGYNGDIFDRYLVRMEEIRQSLRILKQVVKDIPEGPVMTGRANYQPRVPAGESYGRVEAPKGELGYYIISTGKQNPWRYHVRAPSFINLTSLEEISVHHRIADVVVILGSIDIVLGEVDR